MEETEPPRRDWPSDVQRLDVGGREILLVGTAHISRESAELAAELSELFDSTANHVDTLLPALEAYRREVAAAERERVAQRIEAMVSPDTHFRPYPHYDRCRVDAATMVRAMTDEGTP